MEPLEELRYLVLAAQREGSRALADALRPAGLTPAQAEVLAVLDDAGRPLSVRELGELLVCETGSPSRLAAAMVGSGHLVAERDARDGRVTRLRLTDAGTAALGAVRAAERELHDRLAPLGAAPETLEEVIGALRGLVADRPTGRNLERRRALRSGG